MTNKIYPEMIKWSLNEQARYIRGFIDGEGGPRFYKRKTLRKGHFTFGEPIRAVDISNSNRCLLNTTSKMLENFGIKSGIYLDAKKGERKATKNSWKLKITERASLIRFSDKIGFSDREKQKTLRKMISSYR